MLQRAERKEYGAFQIVPRSEPPVDLDTSERFDWTRMIDVVVACGAIVFFAPLMLAVACLITAQDGGPVIFAQTRIGRNGRTFKCYKFRSMLVDAEQRLKALLDSDPRARAEWALDHKLRRDPRITSLGSFLRKSSIDELPQFFNVLKGEMSIVGPRPIVPAEITRYGTRFKYYCAVRPGITGLWQVSGRNDVSYRSRVAMDVTYARSKSVPLDIWIMLSTFRVVISRQGSY